MFRQGKQIKAVKIIGSCTTEIYPHEGNYTFLTLEITLNDDSSREESYTKNTAMWWYGNYFSQDDLDNYYNGKKGIIYNPIKAATMGASALIGGLTYGGWGFFAGAISGYVTHTLAEQFPDLGEMKKIN
jgi:hypothetical protein